MLTTYRPYIALRLFSSGSTIIKPQPPSSSLQLAFLAANQGSSLLVAARDTCWSSPDPAELTKDPSKSRLLEYLQHIHGSKTRIKRWTWKMSRRSQTPFYGTYKEPSPTTALSKTISTPYVCFTHAPCRILPALSRPRTRWQAGKHYHVGCIIRKFLSCLAPPVVLQISQKPDPSLAMQRTNP
jgi:hypothetical protein